MYHYLDDKKFIHRMRASAGDIMQALCHFLKEDFDIGANFYLVGSGARKSFNKALNLYDLSDCEDSKSALTSKPIYFKSGNKTEFSIDVCITYRDKNGEFNRLIHEKTGWTCFDKYYWNTAPNSSGLKKKADYIKKCGNWDLVREEYLKIKNRYLIQNDFYHPSFICYIEAVNNVYNIRNRR